MTRHIAPLIQTKRFDRYFEPFCGSAAVFLSLGFKGPAFLNDKQSQIIKIYRAIKDDPAMLFAEFRMLSEAMYEKGGSVYYDVRENARSAADWLFLFYSSFNGLIRFSNKDPNKFNASWGKRYSKLGDALSMKKPVHELVTMERLNEMSALFANASLACGDYWDCIKDCGKGDMIYLDPPYTFNGKDEASEVYNMGWGEAEDRLLAERLAELESRGALWILSNVSESRGKRNKLYMDELYADHKKKEIPYKYTIGGGQPATEVKELLVLSKY